MSPAACFPALCFGKLPTFADFVRHNASGREVLAFDQWLQQGIHHARAELQADWDDSYHRSSAYHFLFFPENSENFLLGVLQPSHDRSERTYPFIVALRVDRRLAASRIPLAPLLFAPFFDRAQRLIGAASQGMTSQELADRTEQLQAPVDRDYVSLSREYESYLSRTTIRQLCENVWDNASDPRLLLTLKNLLDILTPLRGRNAARLALGLRFPLPTHAPELHATAVFWILAAFRSAASSPERPFFFWTAPRADTAESPRANGATPHHSVAAHLFLYLRQPSATSVLQLLRTDLKSESICDVDVDGLDRVREAQSVVPSRLAAAASATDSNLLQLLEVLGAPMLRTSIPQPRVWT